MSVRKSVHPTTKFIFISALILYHTIQTLNERERDGFKKKEKKKDCGKWRKCWLPAFSPFPTMFSNRLVIQGH